MWEYSEYVVDLKKKSLITIFLPTLNDLYLITRIGDSWAFWSPDVTYVIDKTFHRLCKSYLTYKHNKHVHVCLKSNCCMLSYNMKTGCEPWICYESWNSYISNPLNLLMHPRSSWFFIRIHWTIYWVQFFLNEYLAFSRNWFWISTFLCKHK